MARSYDPRTDGADCDNCPMRRWHGTNWKPVGGEHPAGARTLILGESPGLSEWAVGRPFVGKSGKLLDNELARAKFHRGRDTAIDNRLACLPPGEEPTYDLIDVKLRKEKKEGTSPAHEEHPEIHCAARAEKLVRAYRNIVPVGGRALEAVIGGSRSILAYQGGVMVVRTLPNGTRFIEPDPDDPAWNAGMTTLPAQYVLPAVHPAFVLRKLRWIRAFRTSLIHAKAFFGGERGAEDGDTIYSPSPQQLREFLATPSPYWTFDVETSDKTPLDSRLYCLAITADRPGEPFGSGNRTIVVPFASVETGVEFYPPDVRAEVVSLLCSAFLDGRVWVGHNAGSFDRLVLLKQFGIVQPIRILDTIQLHRGAWSEEGHALGTVAPLYLFIRQWKQDNDGRKLASAAPNRKVQEKYCATDTRVTHRILPKLWNEARDAGVMRPCPGDPSMTLLELDHSIQEIASGLHRTGLFIDQQARAEIEEEQRSRVDRAQAQLLQEVRNVGWPASDPFNPRSVNHVKRLLFQELRLLPLLYTDSEEPSTGDEVLRAYLNDGNVPARAKDIIRYLRRFRKGDKLLSSFILPCRSVFDGGSVGPDGRLRASWATLTTTRRWSSADPMNVQNWPKAMRRMVRAAEGHLLVGADKDQLELRFFSALWNLRLYIEAFRAGKDAHQVTMHLYAGDRIWTLDGAPPMDFRFLKEWKNLDGSKGEIAGKFDEERTFGKRFVYAEAYGAIADTVVEILKEVENDDGSFPYARLDAGQLDPIIRRFRAALPELETGWESTLAEYRRQGYLDEPITGGRRKFLDGEDRNEIVNFKVQSGGAGMMNLATHKFVNVMGYRPFFAGPGTGLIQQGHDSLVVEVPEARAEEVRQRLTEAMDQEFPTIFPGMRFPGKAKIGQTWNKV